MKAVNQNKKVFGVCKNGKVYGNPNLGVVNLYQYFGERKFSNMSITEKVGYQTYIDIKATNNFKLYQVVNNELVQVQSDVPNKLVVKGGPNQSETEDSVLIYNGDGTFSITKRSYDYPRDSKMAIGLASDIYVGILDANNMPFYTDTDIFSSRTPSTSDFSGYIVSNYTSSVIYIPIKNINIEINNELDMSSENSLNGEYSDSTQNYYSTQWGPGDSRMVSAKIVITTLTLKSVYK